MNIFRGELRLYLYVYRGIPAEQAAPANTKNCGVRRAHGLNFTSSAGGGTFPSRGRLVRGKPGFPRTFDTGLSQ